MGITTSVGWGALCTLLVAACHSNPAGSSDESAARLENLCAPRHELPVVTHYDKLADAPRYLASDQVDLWAPYGPKATDPYSPGQCHPIYTGGRMPDLDHYVGNTWSTTAISNDDATKVMRGLCESTRTAFRLLRPDAVGTSRIASGSGEVQVVHGIVVDDSLITVVLPANWSKVRPNGGYPLVVNGFYDLNDNVFKQEGPHLLRMIAESSSSGRTGAIGVLWNGGGAQASRTVSSRAQDQFASVIDLVKREFAGDPQRILMFGGSRGGVTALTMASNPKRHPYRVTFVAAAVPPTLLGEHALLASATFPSLFYAEAWSTGFHDAWRTGWRYPACAGKPHLTGKTAPEAHLFTLLGTFDPAVANDHFSLMSPSYLAGLKAAGTQVHLEVGSHDNIVPYAHQVEYGRKLFQVGIPLEAKVYVRAGHFGRDHIQRTRDALQAYVDPRRGGAHPTVTPGVSFYRVNRAANDIEPFNPPDGKYPFTLEGPRFITPGDRFPLVMVGEPGTEWEVGFVGTSAVWRGTIAETGKAIQWVDVGQDVPLGDYAYQARIRKPGADWKEIPKTQTIDGSPGVITVVATPNMSAAAVASAAMAATIPAFPNTAWGLSEY